jgi:hypothetical protein
MGTIVVHPSKSQLKAVIDFLEALNVPFEKREEQLPQHVLEGIKKGQEDFKASRTLTLDEFKKQRAIERNV